MKNFSSTAFGEFNPWRAASGLLLFAAVSLTIADTANRQIPPAFGSHVNLKPADFAEATSFRSTDQIVGTYYFYWYDTASKEHVLNGDGTDALSTHPPALEGLSWKSVAWHRSQLEDRTTAGIDLVLPVFWSAPSEQQRKPGCTGATKDCPRWCRRGRNWWRPERRRRALDSSTTPARSNTISGGNIKTSPRSGGGNGSTRRSAISSRSYRPSIGR